MTSLLGRLSRLFPESVRLEDLFTEAVARLFEANPRLCLEWLESEGLLSAGRSGRLEDGRVSVVSQKWLGGTEGPLGAGRIDLQIEVRWPTTYEPGERRGGGQGEATALTDVIMVESKVGSREREEQLRRFAGHLAARRVAGIKTLVYVTRSPEPKDREEIFRGTEGGGVGFRQLRWRDFYRFLSARKEDSLVREVMTFMEEEGMSENRRIGLDELAALGRLPRALEILGDVLDDEVRDRMRSLGGGAARVAPPTMGRIRNDQEYFLDVPLTHDGGFGCYAGIALTTEEGLPLAQVGLYAEPHAPGREALVEMMGELARRHDWCEDGPEDPEYAGGVWREASIAALLSGEDDVGAIRGFLVESLAQIEDGLGGFRREGASAPGEA